MRFNRPFAVFALAAVMAAWPFEASADETAATSRQQLHGFVVSVHGNVLTLKLRNGTSENVDLGPAQAQQHTGVLPVGRAVVVYGTRDAAGTFHVTSVGHTSQLSQSWSPDQ